MKEERAIVSDIEGTTRDWLESWASINGIPVRLFDTAGLRQTSDVIEAQGVEISRSLVQDADVVLYLVDGTQGMNDEDREFIEKCEEPLIVVFTKSDKNSDNTGRYGVLAQVTEKSDDCLIGVPAPAVLTSKTAYKSESGSLPPSSCKISSKTGEGMAELFSQIYGILTAGIAGNTTERSQAGLGSARQKEAVAAALESVRHALVSADDNYTLDAVVQDLEDALDSLGEVTGDVTPDDVLGSIFANFCVGK